MCLIFKIKVHFDENRCKKPILLTILDILVKIGINHRKIS